MKISKDLLDQLVAHALEDPRIECCGFIAIDPGSRSATRVLRARNIHATALKFEMDPMEQLNLTNEIEDQGWEIGAIYHSHVRSPPYPSQTDVNVAVHSGKIEWLIVGLGNGQAPEVRSYLIDETGAIEEVPVESDA